MNNLITLKNFYKNFIPDELVKPSSEVFNQSNVLQFIIDELGGKSFNRGLFAIYTTEDMKTYTKFVEDAFPNAKGKVYCFGRDWLNRQFAITIDDNSSVVMFDLCFDSVLDIDSTLIDFFEKVIVEKRDALFAEDFFLDWEKSSNEELNYEKCVNYKVLPILGGEDDIENLEVVEPRFAYELNMGIIQGTKKLHDGDNIGKVTIDEETPKKKPWWKF